MLEYDSIVQCSTLRSIDNFSFAFRHIFYFILFTLHMITLLNLYNTVLKSTYRAVLNCMSVVTENQNQTN